MDLHSLYSPFGNRGVLLGRRVAVDDAGDAVFSESDVAEIVRLAEDGNQFDGSAAVIVRLHDGRFAAWDLSYAGNDFSDGNGVVFVGRTPELLVPHLSTHGQRLLARVPR